MLQAYIDFVQALFPNISPYVKDNAKESIRQFYINKKEFLCFTGNCMPQLGQGDIIGSLPFHYYNDAGDENEYITDGLVLSNSCDVENDHQILIAPFIPINSLKLDAANLKNNLYYSLLYFPDYRYSNSVADLSLISPFSKNLILNKLADGMITKKYSLNLIGYYLLISKITVHLLRPEDIDIQTIRNSDCV
jgi:hypothetical protein